MSRLQNTVALITGGSRGIGRAIAMRFAQEGALVALTARNLEPAQKVVAEIQAVGGKAQAYAVDVTSPAGAESCIKEVVAQLGALHILVNNAGGTADNLIMRMSDEEWNKVIEVNLTGMFYCIRPASKVMMKQRAGKIINVTSVVAQMGNKGQANYCAAKAGVIGLTKSVARELASRNIQVNAIAPGFIDTAMTAGLPESAKDILMQSIPLGRIGTPEDVAAAALFLASDDSNYVTGQVFNVDGGMVMS